jgi:caffeoyl-CoA O-methyltransferase
VTLTEAQKSFFRNGFGDLWPFVDSLEIERDQLFHELEKQARSLGVYSIGPWFGRLLNLLVRFAGVKSALEFGTASGYSAIWIARGMPQGGKLVTIERNARLAGLARENVSRAGLQDNVDIRIGEARDIVRTLAGPFDLIFVDCAHFEALGLSQRALRSGGLFVCDNVGLFGMDDFNHALIRSPHLETLVLQCYLKGRTPENTAFSISIKT